MSSTNSPGTRLLSFPNAITRLFPIQSSAPIFRLNCCDLIAVASYDSILQYNAIGLNFISLIPNGKTLYSSGITSRGMLIVYVIDLAELFVEWYQVSMCVFHTFDCSFWSTYSHNSHDDIPNIISAPFELVCCCYYDYWMWSNGPLSRPSIATSISTKTVA